MTTQSLLSNYPVFNPWTNIGTANPRFPLNTMQQGNISPFDFGPSRGPVGEAALLSDPAALRSWFNRAIAGATVSSGGPNWDDSIRQDIPLGTMLEKRNAALQTGTTLTPFAAAYARRQFDPLFGQYQFMEPFFPEGDQGTNTFRQFLGNPLATRGALQARLGQIADALNRTEMDRNAIQDVLAGIYEDPDNPSGALNRQRQALELVATKGINPIFAGPIRDAIRRLASTFGVGSPTPFLQAARQRGYF